MSPLNYKADPVERKSMLGADIIVRAVLRGQTIPNAEDDPDLYKFEESDTGILRWKCSDNIRFWEPTVIWDHDVRRHPRRTLVMNLEVVGIEVQGCRFYYGPASSLKDAP